MAHWVSEFKRVELPQVITEVRQVADSNSKMLVNHRHVTTVSWNVKPYCNNNITRRPPPLSHFHRSTSKSYIFVQNHEEVDHFIKDKGDDGIVQSVQIKNHHSRQNHFVEVKKMVNN